MSIFNYSIVSDMGVFVFFEDGVQTAVAVSTCIGRKNHKVLFTKDDKEAYDSYNYTLEQGEPKTLGYSPFDIVIPDYGTLLYWNYLNYKF